MDSRDNFIKELGEFLVGIDVDYLIGVSNKGIVNRAGKDLDKLDKVEYIILDDSVEFKFDEITCAISEDITKYKCSCPSRSICKHIIMGYLYLIKNNSDIFGDICEVSSDKKGEFTELKEYSIEEIKRVVGDKVFDEILKRIEFGIKAEISEGSVITVDFKDENKVIKLLPSLKNSVCSCKSKELCKHKAEALILYKIEKKYISIEEISKYKSNVQYLDKENVQKVANRIRRLVEDILITGLSRIPLTILDTINSLAITCHKYDFPNFEKSLREIREEFILYINKNAAFDRERLLNKLTSIYLKSITIEKSNDIQLLTKLIGEFKSSYYEIPPINLWGIAAEKWVSKSGYEGTTYYFMNNEREEIFSYTYAMPTYYDNKSRYHNSLKAAAPWGLSCNVEELCNINFKLAYGRINIENRISSSNNSEGTILGESNLKTINTAKFIYDDWTELINKKFLSNSGIDKTVFLKPYKIENSIFDDISQESNIHLFDKYEKKIYINIQFSKETKNMIRKLERIAKYKNVPTFFGKVYMKNGKIEFYPIAYYSKDGYADNLTIY